MTEKKRQLTELLKIHFNHESFLPGQERAVDAILSGRDTVVVLPTGGGKSLIYQLPALVLEGTTLVISPLIALMKDQVDSLERVGIPAAFINSSLSPQAAEQRLAQAKAGEYKIIYIAPERFYNQAFAEALKRLKVSLFAIDEAHCISQWGHDFRPSYLKLRQAAKLAGNPPIVALTATATPEVREDIVRQLDLDEPELVITGFARPNLQLAVVNSSPAEKLDQIASLLSANPEIGSGIVYVGTRAKADELNEILNDCGVKAVVYHAGMDSDSRDWVQEQFMSGAAQVVVATNAFGLGINKKDIRFVIHHDLPGTIEAYYQEAGRAGRDGQSSFCLLFYNQQDRYLREFFIKGDNPSPEIIREVYDFIAGRLGGEVGTESLLVTYSEIAQSLSETVPEMAIGTALKILEREGYISRPNEKNSSSFLKASRSWEQVLSAISPRAKSQQQIARQLGEKYGQELQAGWEFNLEEAALVIKVKRDSLLRAVKKLAEQNLVEYRPPFRGTEIKILKTVAPEDLNLDFKALREKAERAYEKLDEMESYVRQTGCRQEYILKYFGDLDSKPCGHCDNCQKLSRHMSRGGEDYTQREYLSFD